MNRKLIYFLFLSVFLFIGCRSAKKSMGRKKTTTTQNNTTTTQDNSVVTTTKEVDTKVQTKKDSVIGVIAVKEVFDDEKGKFKPVDTTYHFTSGKMSIDVNYNSKNKTFNIKAKKEADTIDVKSKETTVEHKDIKTTTNNQSKQETIEKTKNVERTSKINWTLISIIGLIILALLIFVLIRIYVPNLFNKNKVKS